MLKYSKDKQSGDYDYTKAPTLRIKMPQWEGVWKSEIYDEDGNKLYPSQGSNSSPIDYLKKGSNIACLIQFAGIWFVNGKFSASWKLVQAVVQKPRATLQGQCFIKLKTQDKEKLKTQVVEDDVDDHVTSTIVEDSDNEDNESVDVVSTPVVQPTVVVEEVKEPEPVAQVTAAQVTADEPKKVVKRVVKKKTDA
jgi:hypothetical protein